MQSEQPISPFFSPSVREREKFCLHLRASLSNLHARDRGKRFPLAIRWGRVIANFMKFAMILPAARFMESFGLQFRARIGAMNPTALLRNADTPVRVVVWRQNSADRSVRVTRRFMGSFDLQFWTHIAAMKVARLSKVEEDRAVTTDSTLESRATCRFMGSLHGLTVAHWDHEPAAMDNCGVVQLRNCSRTRFMESFHLQLWTRIGAMNRTGDTPVAETDRRGDTSVAGPSRRFMESSHSIAVAHWNYESAAKKNCGVVQLRNLSRTRFMGSFDLQFLDAHWGHEPAACNNCGVDQLRNSPRRRSLGRPCLQIWTRIAAINRQRVIANFMKFAMILPAARFMESFGLQFRTHIRAMNVARLSKVEMRRAIAPDSTLESRATCRFMETGHGNCIIPPKRIESCQCLY